MIRLILASAIFFALWRNYGVIAKGDVVNLDAKTNEAKELSGKIKQKPSLGDTLTTSFGVYEYQEKGWCKIKEVWD